jgi:hypothetical protein
MSMKREHHTRVDEGDIETLLHPSQLYEHPSEVVSDPDLTLNEKRAVLASWASDACAVEAMPALRKGPNGRVVAFDEIMDALRALDRLVVAVPGRPRESRVAVRNAKSGRGDDGHGNHGAPLH